MPLVRFAFHDLLRTYAAELALAHDPAADRRGALHRVFDHYLHTAEMYELQGRYRDELGHPDATAVISKLETGT